MFKAEFSGKKIDDVEKELAKQGIIDVEIVKNDSKRDDGYDSELVVRADVTGKPCSSRRNSVCPFRFRRNNLC